MGRPEVSQSVETCKTQRREEGRGRDGSYLWALFFASDSAAISRSRLSRSCLLDMRTTDLSLACAARAASSLSFLRAAAARSPLMMVTWSVVPSQFFGMTVLSNPTSRYSASLPPPPFPLLRPEPDCPATRAAAGRVPAALGCPALAPRRAVREWGTR